MLTKASPLPSEIQTIENSDEGISKHIYFTLESDEICTDDTTYQVSFEIFCDSTVTGTLKDKDFTIDASDECHPVITATHEAGCPVLSFTALVAYVSENPWILAVFLIATGPIVCFWGRKFIPWVISIAGGFITFAFVLLLCSVSGMLDYIDPTQQGGNIGLVLLSFALAAVLGALVGFLLWKFIMVGLVILGGIAGFFAGTLLYNLVLVTFMQNEWAYIATVIICATIGATLAHYFRDHVVIFSTALIGAYATVRGASLFIGDYPNEITMY